MNEHLPDCAQCPLQRTAWCGAYFTSEPESFNLLRRTDERIRARRSLYPAGSASRQILTLRNGWAVSYSILRNGQRQILAIYIPGDVIGLNALLTESSALSIAAVTDAALCGFVMSDVVVQGLRSPSVAAEFLRRCLSSSTRWRSASSMSAGAPRHRASPPSSFA